MAHQVLTIITEDIIEEDTSSQTTSDHVGRCLFDYIVEANRHDVMELMAKYE